MIKNKNNSHLTIRIYDPKRYYHWKDEYYFFKWLNSIDFVVKYVGVKQFLDVHVKPPIKKEGLHAFIGLLTRYGVPIPEVSHLPLKKSVRKWFLDPIGYWNCKR